MVNNLNLHLMNAVKYRVIALIERHHLTCFLRESTHIEHQLSGKSPHFELQSPVLHSFFSNISLRHIIILRKRDIVSCTLILHSHKLHLAERYTRVFLRNQVSCNFLNICRSRSNHHLIVIPLHVIPVHYNLIVP